MNNLAFGIIIVLLLVCLIILFCILLIKLYIQKIKKYNQILFEKELEHQKKINQTVLETQEQTLHMIAQELHDDAGQQITYINFQLEHLKLDKPTEIKVIQPISDSVYQLSNTIRNLSHSLNNQILSQENLLQAIRVEVVRISNVGKVETAFQLNGILSYNFSIQEKIVIYRIFQEVVNNMFKYSKATIFRVEVLQDPIRFIFSDNGIGFDLDTQIENYYSNGIKNMMERANLIDYSITFQSDSEKGTVITLTKKHDNDRNY